MAPRNITNTSRARQRHDLLGVLRFERELADAAGSALRKWLPLAEQSMFGTLTAATTPDPQSVYAVAQSWLDIVDAELLPTVESLMVERMAEHMQASGVAAGLPPAPDDVEEAAAVARSAIHTATATEYAAVAYAAPGVRELQQQYLSEVSNRLVNVPDTVFNVLRAELDTSMAEGEDPRARAARMRSVLSWAGSDQWPNRAMTIARTEATGAYNQASVWAAQARAIQFDEPLRKVWLSTVDGRTRDSHFRADGQTVPMDGRFRVGRANLDYPGDPRGPAEEVINCRCTVMELGPDDDVPPEIDRQTERGEGDSTVRNRKGSQKDEVNRRADDGVVRARDAATPTDAILAAGQHEEKIMTKLWRGALAPMGKVTGDQRMFASNAEVSFREFPLPLMWQRQTKDGHMDAYTVGSIRSASVENGQIIAEGVFFDTPESLEAQQQVVEGVTRPSVDLCDETWQLVDKNGNPLSEEELYSEENQEDPEFKVIFQFTSFRVMAATLVAKPAFAEAKIELVDGGDDEQAGTEASLTQAEVGLVAAAAPGTPVYSTGQFIDPRLTEPTPLHMTEEGRIQGHLALWNDCHMGVGDACVVAPRTRTGYALFHVAEVQTDEGPLAVGKLTVGGGHADPKLGVQPTVEHYDNAGTGFALVRAGEDEHGIWVSGVAAPWAAAEQVQLGLSCPLSGDWRRHGGNLELVAALSVNTPGFPVPRGKRDERGRDYALVAAGVMPTRMSSLGMKEQTLLRAVDTAVREAVADAMATMAENSTYEARAAVMAEKVNRIRESRTERQLANVSRQRAEIIRNRTINGGK